MKKKSILMKVCMIYDSLSIESGGGISNVIYNIINNTRNRVDYTLLARYESEDLAIARKMYGRIPVILIRSNNSLSKYAEYSRQSKLLRTFDVLHYHKYPFGYDLPLFLKIRNKRCPALVYTHHFIQQSINCYLDNSLMRSYFHNLMKVTIKFWRKITAPSKRILEELRSLPVSRSKLVRISNGVDTEKFAKASPMKLEGSPSILFVGHLEHHKGVDVLLRAFKLLQKKKKAAFLHLVGLGRASQSCIQLAQRLKISDRICFWGQVSSDLMPHIYMGSDIFVLPSRYDASPIVLFEALAAGKPIVTTNICGEEIIKDGRNGFLIPSRANALCEAIRTLADDQNLRNAMARNNRRDSLNYDWSKVAKQYVELYDACLSDG